MAFVVFLLGAAMVTLVGVALVLVTMHLRAGSHARRARAELERAAHSGDDGAVLVRGKLVVEGDGCAPELGEQGPKIAARTPWGSTRRLWFADAAAGSSDRAAKLWLDTKDGRVLVEGPVMVAAGAKLRWLGFRGGQYEHGKLFDAVAVLEEGDDAIALGKRRDDPESRREGPGYRDPAVRMVLEPLPEGGVVRLAAASPPRASFRAPALLVHRGVLAVAFLALAPGWLMAKDYETVATTCQESCAAFGECHVDTRLRWQGLDAFGLMMKGWFFECAAHDDADCRATNNCASSGQCSARDGECKAVTADDCRLSAQCDQHGWCAPVDGRCRAGSDEDCRATQMCANIGWCSAVDGECRVAKDEDCRLGHFCADLGWCTAVNGECRAVHDEDCRRHPYCESLHHCTAVNGSCAIGPEDCRRAVECRRDGACTVVNGECRAASDEDCVATRGCAEHGSCSAEDGVCVRKGPCAESAACSVHGRCDGDGVSCTVRSERDCKASSGCKEHGQCKLVGSTCAASCATTPDCEEYGACTWNGTICGAASDDDCKRSAACREHGYCTAKNDRCVPSRAGCLLGEPCRLEGRCSASDFDCRALTDDDCRESVACKDKGRCHASEGECKAASEADCAASRDCAELGRCSADHSGCVLGKEDCKKLDPCKESGLCSLLVDYDGRKCRAETDADCKDSEVCRRFGWCSATDGRCFPKRDQR